MGLESKNDRKIAKSAQNGEPLHHRKNRLALDCTYSYLS